METLKLFSKNLFKACGDMLYIAFLMLNITLLLISCFNAGADNLSPIGHAGCLFGLALNFLIVFAIDQASHHLDDPLSRLKILSADSVLLAVSYFVGILLVETGTPWAWVLGVGLAVVLLVLMLILIAMSVLGYFVMSVNAVDRIPLKDFVVDIFIRSGYMIGTICFLLLMIWAVDCFLLS